MHVKIKGRGELVAAEKGVDGQWTDGSMSLEQAFKHHGHWIYPTSHGQVKPNNSDTPVGNGVTVLDFAGTRVGDASIRKVAHILKANTTISTLNLAWTAVGDASATRLADALWSNTVLRSLDLSNNEITDAGATSLARALDGKVSEIEQTETKVDESSESEMPWQPNPGNMTSIKILGSQGSKSGKEIPRPRNGTLQKINLGYNHLGAAGMKRVLDIFRSNEGITSISLAGAGPAPKASDLGSALQRNRLLRVLNLSGIGLSEDCGLALSTVISPSAGFSSLTTLHLASNKFGNEGAISLAEALHPIHVDHLPSEELAKAKQEYKASHPHASSHHHSVSEHSQGSLASHHHSVSEHSQGSPQALSPISRVYKRDNRRRSSEVFTEMVLERSRVQPFLTSLDLRDNGIRSEGMTSIASMLKQNRSLKYLMLLDNVCGDDGALELARGAQKNPHLETLFFYDNSIGFDSVQEISEILRGSGLATKDMVFDFGHVDDREFDPEDSRRSEEETEYESNAMMVSDFLLTGTEI